VFGNPDYCMGVETEGAEIVYLVVDAELEAEQDTLKRQKEAGKCMICGAALGRKEDVVWCRRCGRLAHRIHLLDWMTTKKYCPACGATLDDKYYH
jgi:ribosomal protein L37E